MVLVGDFFLILNLFPLIILFILTFLEIGVAVVQAYIFVTLTTIYLKDGIIYKTDAERFNLRFNGRKYYADSVTGAYYTMRLALCEYQLDFS